MAERMADQDLFDGCVNTADPRLQAAMLVLLKFGEVMRDDGLPLGRDVIAFADLYKVPASALGGLVGFLHGRFCPVGVTLAGAFLAYGHDDAWRGSFARSLDGDTNAGR